MSTQSPFEEQFTTLLQFAIILQFKPEREQHCSIKSTGMNIYRLYVTEEMSPLIPFSLVESRLEYSEIYSYYIKCRK